MRKLLDWAVLLTVLGGILGLTLAIAFVWNWFGARWQELEASPEPIVELIHIERDQVWVESESGILFKYNDAENCQSDCWMTVQSLPSPVWYDDPNLLGVKDSTCSPALPLSRVEIQIEQCRQEMWANRNYVFALRRDGSLHFWRSEVYGEWLVVELFLGLCGGAICFSLPAFLLALLPRIIQRLKKKRTI